MNSRTSLLVLAVALGMSPLAAQDHVNQRLAQGQPARYTPPLCPLKAMNSKVEKAVGSLRKAYEAKTPAEKSTLLTDAKSSIVSAILNEAQGSNGAAWYYLGRVALLQGDPAGTDSAFTTALELVPSCEIDITQYRQNNWALLGQAGIEMQRKGETDSAIALFRDASFLFRGLPHVYSNMGVVFASSGRDDSAAVYFEKALAIAERDTSLVEDRNGAMLNLAIMYQRLKKWPESIVVLKKYLAWKPDDTDAKKTLASSYRNAGLIDSANAVENAMVARLSTANLDSLDTQDLMSVGVAAFNAGKFPAAETAFGKAAKRNPWSRDARYNLANTYLAQASKIHDVADALRKAADSLKKPADAARKAALVDSAGKIDATAAKFDQGLIDESTKLLEIEPMNDDVLRLMAQGQRNLKQTDSVLKTAERLVALPFTIDVQSFQMGHSGARFLADAIGRSPQDPTGKPLKVSPVTVVVEFVDSAGAVLDTKEVQIPALASTEKSSISAEGKAAGITAWRYRVKA